MPMFEVHFDQDQWWAEGLVVSRRPILPTGKKFDLAWLLGSQACEELWGAVSAISGVWLLL
jgi:hypothetical protein